MTLIANWYYFHIFEIQKKTVTVTKQKNQTIDGSLSIKLKSGNGTTGSSTTKKPAGDTGVSVIE